jgi:hypothetical protein
MLIPQYAIIIAEKGGRIQVSTLIEWRREIERHFVNLLVQGLLYRKDCTV